MTTAAMVNWAITALGLIGIGLAALYHATRHYAVGTCQRPTPTTNGRCVAWRLMEVCHCGAERQIGTSRWSRFLCRHHR